MKKIVIKIPVGNLTREQAEKSLRELMSEYGKSFNYPEEVRELRKKKFNRIFNEV